MLLQLRIVQYNTHTQIMNDAHWLRQCADMIFETIWHERITLPGCSFTARQRMAAGIFYFLCNRSELQLHN